MAETTAVDAQSLRRTQSTGDIPTVAPPSRARISASHRRSGQGGHHTNPSSPVNNAGQPDMTPWLRQAGQTPNRTQDSLAPAQLAPTRRPQSLYARTKDFLGMGPNASRTRKALVSLVWTMAYSFLQVAAIIAVLSVASVTGSPQDSSIDQIKACGRPLVAWNCIWIVRLALSSGLAYWNFLRIRAADSATREDPETTTRPSTSQGTRTTDTRQRRQRDRRSRRTSTASTSASAGNPEEPAIPYSQIYARLSLFSSMLTLTWFLTAHILEYTSVDTCRLSAPLVWWLTFAILCTMYFLVLEVVLFGFLVFMILPFIMLFYSIVLLCLGRHPLQNPHYIKPEIGKLSKSIVDRIPLVIYIPPPPDDESTPISLPKPVHSYPPKQPGSLPKRRFAFFRKKTSKKDKVVDGASDKTKKSPIPEEKNGPETWEDNWEQCEHPFVRLEGNRAACAICLMDFEEPKRLSGLPKEEEPTKDVLPIISPPKREEEVEIPVERITEEERDALPRLEDAGEGPQPLRLLACGHVFHKTCIDPWLTDVSGRCPVCQRPVEIDDVEPKKSRRRRRS
ncbi:hypothetical protein HYDPIDRAFT_126363 [Hydnomerulius pinastri MD-312]|nr:hypothetical protein HYDPIDRAFT_126363 [Hydnomerulius pinastri MD-312]